MPEQSLPARGSLRSRGAATVSAVTLRQISAVLPPERAWGLWASRQIIARVMDTFGPSLAGTEVEQVDVRLADGRRVVGEWVRSGAVTDQTEAIYYVHGSGYALCSPRTHRRLTAWLSRLTGLPVFCVDYRLAPKYRFPTAADDVRAGWDYLRTERGHDPERMVIAGDSAGGHLAVDLLLQPGVPHPAALALFSPLVDLTFGLARAREALRDDPAIRASDAARLDRVVLRRNRSAPPPTHPRRRRRPAHATHPDPGRWRGDAAGRRPHPGRGHPRRRRHQRVAGLAGSGARLPGSAPAHSRGRSGHAQGHGLHR